MLPALPAERPRREERQRDRADPGEHARPVAIALVGAVEGRIELRLNRGVEPADRLRSTSVSGSPSSSLVATAASAVASTWPAVARLAAV